MPSARERRLVLHGIRPRVCFILIPKGYSTNMSPQSMIPVRSSVVDIQANPSAPPSWLQPHEEIVWVGETQYGNRGWGGGLIVTLSGTLLVMAGVFGSSFGFILVGALFFLVGAPLTY